MSYLAMYRKYRSKTFDEILGQDHVVTTLKNQIMGNKIAHAYLFCGIRGTGKTSLAKIFAKTVNCENPVNGNPCLECEMCLNIEKNTNLNVFEIDAASNNGVEHIRELRNDTKYLPNVGKYKVYIIDEVHMLSASAFNALLKVLEEPPAHVIFILATTEAHKIPATILSRCQRYDLKRIAKKEIAERMKAYIQEEGQRVEDAAVNYIASLSEGSMRDALSVLEQVLSMKPGEEVKLDDILSTLGNVDYSTYYELTQRLVSKDLNEAIGIVNKIYNAGKDIKNFINQYIAYLRNLLLASYLTQNKAELDMPLERMQELVQLSKKLENARVIDWIEKFAKLEQDIKYASTPKLALEILLIKLCSINVGYIPVVPENAEIETEVLEEEIEEPEQEEEIKPKEPEKEVTLIFEKVIEPKMEQTTEEKEVELITDEKIKEPDLVLEDIKEITRDIRDIKEKNELEEMLLKKWDDVIENADGPLKAMLLRTKAFKIEADHYFVLVDDAFTKGYLERAIDLLKVQLPLQDEDMSLVFILKTDLVTSENKKIEKVENNINHIINSLEEKGVSLELYE